MRNCWNLIRNGSVAVRVAHAGRLQMLVQVGLEGEGLVAPGALEVLIGRVGLHVRAQVAAVGERFAAVRAPVRLLAGVRSEVALQQPRPREQLAADSARVVQFVGQQVHGQRWHTDVGLATGDALLGRLRVEAAVGLLVPGEVRRGGVLLAALGARVLGPLVAAAGRRPVDGRGQRGLLLGAAVAHEERLVRVGDGLGGCRFAGGGRRGDRFGRRRVRLAGGRRRGRRGRRRAQVEDGVGGAQVFGGPPAHRRPVVQRVRPVDVLLFGRQREGRSGAGEAHGQRSGACGGRPRRFGGRLQGGVGWRGRRLARQVGRIMADVRCRRVT